MKIKKRYDRPDNVELITSEDSLVQQQFAESTRVRNILDKFMRTGMIDSNPLPPRYEDVSEVQDYQSAMNLLVNVQGHFDVLPSKIRDRFGNDPEKYLAFINDPNNLDEAVELGLLQKSESAPINPAQPSENATQQGDNSQAVAPKE